MDLIIPQRDMILVRRVPTAPTQPNDIESVSYKVSYGWFRPGDEPNQKSRHVNERRVGMQGDVPLFQLDLARDRTRLRRNELLQIAHRVRGETFHADCVLDTAKKREMNREMGMR